MRRKPVFLGYFALFLVSVFTSFSLLDYLLPAQTVNEPNIVQETPQYRDHVLSPQAVANLSYDTTPSVISTSEPTQPNLLNIELADPANDLTNSENSEQLAVTDQPVEIPLTGTPQDESEIATPRKISIFRTVLAVLLAVAALTLAGFGLYQAYEYFRPALEKYLRAKS